MNREIQHASAVIVAAGRGLRAGGEQPKQWQPLAGKRVIDWALAAFAEHPAIDRVVVVVHPDDVAEVPDGVKWVIGGDTRAASVLAGLKALAEHGPAHVLIHDAARPCIRADTIDAVIEALHDTRAAAPAMPVTDALWRVDHGQVQGVQNRTGLYRAQTPQGFQFDAILQAHLNATAEAADDVEIARMAGLDVAAVPGDPDNIKITAPDDFARAAQILRGNMQVRIGNGFDVHRFGPGDHVVLCGVRIPHGRALSGHSDADVGMHALTDAIYGALADGDIGQHFPPSDEKWKGADSQIFLAHAMTRARERGYDIANADVTLICEEPKIGPHANQMRQALAKIIGCELERVNVKATTSERLGFTGRKEGIAAMATVCLAAP